MSHAANVRQVEDLMGALGVTMHDLTVYRQVENQWEQYASENTEPYDGDNVFQGTVDEAFDRLRADKFTLDDGPGWAEPSYDYERDKVYAALTAAGILVEHEADQPVED